MAEGTDPGTDSCGVRAGSCTGHRALCSRVLQGSRVWGILASHHGIDGVEWEAAMHRGLHLGSAEFLWGVLGG